MTHDDYEKLGYPNSLKRFTHIKYWRRKLHELGNIFLKISRFFGKIYNWRRRFVWIRFYCSEVEKSHSQFGEDLIVLYLWKELLHFRKPFYYLDIGAHHPTEMNNTALLYEYGARGINIEPDPELFDPFEKERPDDVNLNIGITVGNETSANLYVMSTPGWNTFSAEIAERIVREDKRLPEYRDRKQQIEKVVRVPMKRIESVLAEHPDASPDFVTIDAEGMDYEILESWNFRMNRAAIFCIETDKGNKRQIVGLMKSNGYYIFDSTLPNTIFLDIRYRRSRIHYFFKFLKKGFDPPNSEDGLRTRQNNTNGRG